jgi:hypothetical protein
LLLTSFGFAREDVLVLLNEQATHEGIVAAFRKHLIQRAKPNAIVLFHYSGHGSRMPDPEKDPAKRTPSGKLSTIVPVDSRTNGVFDISSSELRGLLTELHAKTKNITFIMDSCHSGIGLKETALQRAVEEDTRQPPPSSAPVVLERNTESFVSRDYALISACRDTEVAFEYASEGAPCGTLTHFLVKQLRSSGAGKSTYRDIMDRVRAEVTGVYQLQHPQLEGANMENLIFTMQTLTARPYVLVSPKGKDVVLAAGRVQGVTLGSIYDIYSPQSKSFDATEKPIAQAEVTSVDFNQSIAKLPNAVTIPVASRAVERRHNYEGRKLKVYFDTKNGRAVIDKVRAALKVTRSLVENDGNTPTFTDTFEEISEPTGARFILRETKESIVLEDAGEGELSPPLSAGDPEAAQKILKRMAGWAKWFRVKDLSNSQSDLKVDFLIKKAGGDDQQFKGGPVLTLADGDELEFTVTNRSGKDVYFAILDLTSTGKIGLVYPGAGRNQVLAADRPYSEKVQVSVPEGRNQIRDHLKLMVTETDVDFSSLLQEGVKAADRNTEENPLCELLGESLFKMKDVSASPRQLNGWMTMTRVLDVVR